MKSLFLMVRVMMVMLVVGQSYASACRGACDEKSLVQIAILLDTSNSMDGLIEQAKSQLWRVTNDLAYSTRGGQRPILEVALYEYGNNGISRGENHVRQVLPFTTDLDLVSEKLFSLRTNGGQEYCGAVIRDAVHNLRWNKDDNVYKVIFVAGNEPFTQGPVYYRDEITHATRKGIKVNTIFCGPYAEGRQTNWYDGAVIGRGAYMNIDHNHAVAFDPTPYDDEISRLGQDINRTYVAYGARARQALDSRVQIDMIASRLPASSGAANERAIMKGTPQYAQADWDVVSKIASGKQKASDLNRADLPMELQQKSSAELEQHLKDQQKNRDGIQQRLGELKGKRDAFLAKRQAEKAGNPMTLDQAMRQTIREQASRYEFKFDAANPSGGVR